MKRLTLRIAITLCAFVVGVTTFEFMVSKRVEFWKKIGGAQIHFDDHLSAKSAVYRRQDGALLINTGEDNAWYSYVKSYGVYYCDTKKIEEKSVRFVAVRVPGYFYVWRRVDYQCFMPGKIDLRSRLVESDNSIEFDSRQHDRIRVVW